MALRSLPVPGCIPLALTIPVNARSHGFTLQAAKSSLALEPSEQSRGAGELVGAGLIQGLMGAGGGQTMSPLQHPLL